MDKTQVMFRQFKLTGMFTSVLTASTIIPRWITNECTTHSHTLNILHDLNTNFEHHHPLPKCLKWHQHSVRMAHLSAKIKIHTALSAHKVEFVSLQLLSKLVLSLQTSSSISHNWLVQHVLQDFTAEPSYNMALIRHNSEDLTQPV